nr:hypothetical protein [Bacillus andreraoultii]
MNQLGHTQADISLLYINTTREKQRKAAETPGKRRMKKNNQSENYDEYESL